MNKITYDPQWDKPTTVDEAAMRGGGTRGEAQITHYDPATETLTPTVYPAADEVLLGLAELKRLREVEALAREMVTRLNFVTFGWDGDDALNMMIAELLVARACKLGLLE